jgi:hypothetical protein
MYHPDRYPDAIQCVRNRRYAPAASFMTKDIVEKAIHRVSTEQRRNLGKTIARRLRGTHTKDLLAQKGGIALREIAEQAYRDVEAEIRKQLGIEPQRITPLLPSEG